MYMWGEEDWRGCPKLQTVLGYLIWMSGNHLILSKNFKHSYTIETTHQLQSANFILFYFILLCTILLSCSFPCLPSFHFPFLLPTPFLTHLLPLCLHSEKSRPPSDINQTCKTRSKGPRMINMICIISEY